MTEHSPLTYEAADLPSTKMLHNLTRAAFAYGASREDGVVVNTDGRTDAVYFMKDFQDSESHKVGRVARYSRVKRWDVSDGQLETPTGETAYHTFSVSQRVERGDTVFQDEEWQAYVYRWNDEGEVLHSRRLTEYHPSGGVGRQVAPSTAADVEALVRGFRSRLRGKDDLSLLAPAVLEEGEV